MKTLKITKKDLDKDNFYKEKGIGNWDSFEDVSVEIDECLGLVRFSNGIYVNGYILVKAGSGIKAGEGIKAGWGIEAGLSIKCKLSLNIAYRIFAGLALWKKSVKPEEKLIECGRLESGEVCFGELKEIGLPNEKPEINLSGKKVKVELDGKSYTATID